jgi:hypothetical protein
MATSVSAAVRGVALFDRRSAVSIRVDALGAAHVVGVVGLKESYLGIF